MKKALVPLLMLAVGASLGLLTAQYQMDSSKVATPVKDSGWSEIHVTGETLESMYLTGHFMQAGQVPPPKGTRFYVRTSDDDGNSLRGDCVVSVEGTLPLSRWWFMSAASGKARTALDASKTIREANGETIVALSTLPVAGNWLAPPSRANYELQLVLLGVVDADEAPPKLPHVKRLWC